MVKLHNIRAVYLLLPVLLWMGEHCAAQRQSKDKVVYFIDSQTKKSNISLALNASPFFSSRRIMSDSIGAGGLPVGSSNEKRTSPIFTYSFGGDLVFRVASSLEIWLGAQYSVLGFKDKNYEWNNAEYQLDSRLRFINVPIQFSFRGTITEVFDLEFIPVVQLNFLQSYKGKITESGSGNLINEFDITDEARPFNLTLGISLSGNFRLAEEFSLFVRPFFHYMLNPMFENNMNFPRERYFSTGLTLGLRYYLY
ncbi:hypothetical protein [Schleiferia thermophila]|uniref:Outer membrane protein beta-barrel domain-containing protein n=1 Tax=Schleiferia thermophila TaxID=884107 RepID=A0A369A292_9FLAO|nr:hypothetical protein [Schleiferia thermophila]RCX03273.1 hypothetical protein DES35_103155 [Schleiferia thermophila]GCD80402.1 hypothetical protein JCM30197_16490 [Schleiferia thermophila]